MQLASGCSVSDELETLNQLLREWLSAGLDQKLLPEERKQRILELKKMRDRLVDTDRGPGRPRKQETNTYMAYWYTVRLYLQERKEKRLLMIRAVMAEIMGWSADKVREYERSWRNEDTDEDLIQKCVIAREWEVPLLSDEEIAAAHIVAQEKLNGNN